MIAGVFNYSRYNHMEHVKCSHAILEKNRIHYKEINTDAITLNSHTAKISDGRRDTQSEM